MKMMLQGVYIIDGAPVTKKNSQRIAINRVTGKPFILQSQNYKEFEERAGYYLRPRPDAPINIPVNVRYVFYMPSRRRVDLSNLISAMDDILVKHKIVADDNRNIIAAHDGSRVYCGKDNPRTEILIEQMPDSYKAWG